MQKCNLDFCILKIKKQIKMKDKDLLTFFFFVLYNGFVICHTNVFINGNTNQVHFSMTDYNKLFSLHINDKTYVSVKLHISANS